MLASLQEIFVGRFRASRSSAASAPAPRPGHRSVSLSVEVLEDRCLLSADTTVLSPTGPTPLTGLGDVLMAAQPKGNPSVVFVGDSITWGFAYGLGASLWSATLASWGGADYGVSGQTTQTLLYQLALGQLVGVNPAVVVLTIGTNNLLEGDSPQAAAAGIVADVQAIHAYQPWAQVVVLGVPPGSAHPTDPYRLEVDQTDTLVSQLLAGDPRATFVNIAPAFEQPDGTISDLTLFDGIHPTLAGYVNLTEALLAPLADATVASLERL